MDINAEKDLGTLPGFPLDLENLEYGILKKLLNIMEKLYKTWKN